MNLEFAYYDPYTKWYVKKSAENVIFAEFQGLIILKVYKISQRNISYGEAKLYIYKIKKSIVGKLIPLMVY